MKKILVLPAFGAFILLSAPTQGQFNKIIAGIEAGPSIASMRGNRIIAEYGNPMLGFSAGAFFQLNLHKSVALRTNISFERKGFSQGTHQVYDSVLGHVAIKGVSYLDYINLPILARFVFGNKPRFFVNTGPYAGLLIHQCDNSKVNHKKESTNNIDHFKKLDAGISGGAGVEFQYKKKTLLSFEIRNNLGLTDISKLPIIDNGAIKTNSLNFLFSCTFNLK